MINIDKVVINVTVPAQANAKPAPAPTTERTAGQNDAEIALADLIMESTPVVNQHWDALPAELQHSITRARELLNA